MMQFLKTQKGKDAFEKAVQEMKSQNINEIRFKIAVTVELVLVKDKTIEAEEKLKNNLIIDFIEHENERYLVCRN